MLNPIVVSFQLHIAMCEVPVVDDSQCHSFVCRGITCFWLHDISLCLRPAPSTLYGSCMYITSPPLCCTSLLTLPHYSFDECTTNKLVDVITNSFWYLCFGYAADHKLCTLLVPWQLRSSTYVHSAAARLYLHSVIFCHRALV